MSTGGFTLLESLVVLFILALMLAIGMPWWQTISRRNQMRSAASEIQTTLLAVRMKAVRRNSPASVLITTALPTESQHRLETIEPDPPAPTPTPLPSQTLDLSTKTLAFVALPAGNKITFDGNGRRRRAALVVAGGHRHPGTARRQRHKPGHDPNFGLRQDRGRDPDGVAMTRRGSRRSEHGLTLVELLIALALLSFVLLGIAPLFIASMKSNYSANEYTSVNVLARDRLEQLMNLPFNDPLLTPGSSRTTSLRSCPIPRRASRRRPAASTTRSRSPTRCFSTASRTRTRRRFRADRRSPRSASRSPGRSTTTSGST